MEGTFLNSKKTWQKWGAGWKSGRRTKPLLPQAFLLYIYSAADCNRHSIWNFDSKVMEKTVYTNVNANWAELNDDILAQVMEKLNLKDYFLCAAVCVPWGIVFADGIENRKKYYSFPFLLIPPIVDVDKYNQQFSSEKEEEDDQEDDFKLKDEEELNLKSEKYQLRALYNALTNTVVDIHVKLPHNKHCRGSCFGWLITVEETDSNKYQPRLFNPFLSEELAINLPPLDTIAKLDPYIEWVEHGKATYLANAVLSDDPTFSRGDLTVMAFVGPDCKLACLLPGASDWIPVEWEKWSANRFDDLIYISKTRQFYALRRDELVLAIDIVEEHVETRIVVPPGKRAEPARPIKYLVESPSGGLLMVSSSTSVRFEVFELNPITSEWMQIHSLEDCALVLGNNSSRYVSTSDVPGCKSNCIYYTHRWGPLNDPIRWPPHFNGVFNMQDGTSRPHYPLHSGVSITAAIWLRPTFPIGLGSTYICTE